MSCRLPEPVASGTAQQSIEASPFCSATVPASTGKSRASFFILRGILGRVYSVSGTWPHCPVEWTNHRGVFLWPIRDWFPFSEGPSKPIPAVCSTHPGCHLSIFQTGPKEGQKYPALLTRLPETMPIVGKQLKLRLTKSSLIRPAEIGGDILQYPSVSEASSFHSSRMNSLRVSWHGAKNAAPESPGKEPRRHQLPQCCGRPQCKQSAPGILVQDKRNPSNKSVYSHD